MTKRLGKKANQESLTKGDQMAKMKSSECLQLIHWNEVVGKKGRLVMNLLEEKVDQLRAIHKC